MRVLVVDDEVRLGALLSRGLAEDGYTVDVATNGTDALLQASEIAYAVVILDVMLPDTDGVEVCRQLRERGQRIPVLLLSARDTAEDRRRGLDAGADAYLVKPFHFNELCAQLCSLDCGTDPPP
jgi:two-component system OmpR family response regulator